MAVMAMLSSEFVGVMVAAVVVVVEDVVLLQLKALGSEGVISCFHHYSSMSMWIEREIHQHLH